MDREYRYVEPPRDDHVHIRFTGPFQGRRITWDTSITTLEHEFGVRHRSRQPHISPRLRQFIDVGPADGDIRTLRIGLNVGRIDEPVIRKTIIMIRQYKLLHEGYHEYGETWSPVLHP